MASSIFSWMFAGGAAGAAKAAGEVASENIAEKRQLGILERQDVLARGLTEHAQGLSDKSAETSDVRRAGIAKTAADDSLIRKIAFLSEEEKSALKRTTEGRKILNDAEKAMTPFREESAGRLADKAAERKKKAATKALANSIALLTEEERSSIRRTEAGRKILDAAEVEMMPLREGSAGRIAEKEGEIKKSLLRTEYGLKEELGATKGGAGAGANKVVKEAFDMASDLMAEYVDQGEPIPEGSLKLLNKRLKRAGLPTVTNKMVDGAWFGKTFEGISFSDEPKEVKGAQGVIAKYRAMEETPTPLLGEQLPQKEPQKKPAFELPVKKQEGKLAGMGARVEALEKGVRTREEGRKKVISDVLRKYKTPPEELANLARVAKKEKAARGFVSVKKDRAFNALRALVLVDKAPMTLDELLYNLTGQ